MYWGEKCSNANGCSRSHAPAPQPSLRGQKGRVAHPPTRNRNPSCTKHRPTHRAKNRRRHRTGYSHTRPPVVLKVLRCVLPAAGWRHGGVRRPNVNELDQELHISPARKDCRNSTNSTADELEHFAAVCRRPKLRCKAGSDSEGEFHPELARACRAAPAVTDYAHTAGGKIGAALNAFSGSDRGGPVFSTGSGALSNR